MSSPAPSPDIRSPALVPLFVTSTVLGVVANILFTIGTTTLALRLRRAVSSGTPPPLPTSFSSGAQAVMLLLGSFGFLRGVVDMMIAVPIRGVSNRMHRFEITVFVMVLLGAVEGLCNLFSIWVTFSPRTRRAIPVLKHDGVGLLTSFAFDRLLGYTMGIVALVGTIAVVIGQTIASNSNDTEGKRILNIAALDLVGFVLTTAPVVLAITWQCAIFSAARAARRASPQPASSCSGDSLYIVCIALAAILWLGRYILAAPGWAVAHAHLHLWLTVIDVVLPAVLALVATGGLCLRAACRAAALCIWRCGVGGAQGLGLGCFGR